MNTPCTRACPEYKVWNLQEDGHHGVSMAERRAMRDAFGDGDEGGGSDGGDWRTSKFTPEEVR